MRVPTDLHPDDPAARAALAAQLVTAREHLHQTTRDLDRRWGVSDGVTQAMEQRTTWEVRTVQRWARAVGKQLLLQPAGLPEPADDVTTIVLAAADTSTPQRADRAHLRIVCHHLALIRYATITAATLARRIGVTDNAVYRWEGAPDTSSLASVQRYARGLGGTLGLALTDAPVHITAHPSKEPR